MPCFLLVGRWGMMPCRAVTRGIADTVVLVSAQPKGAGSLLYGRGWPPVRYTVLLWDVVHLPLSLAGHQETLVQSERGF